MTRGQRSQSEGAPNGQYVKIMKGKEKLRNCHILAETKEAWQVKAMWDPGTEKDIRGKIGEIQIRSLV